MSQASNAYIRRCLGSMLRAPDHLLHQRRRATMRNISAAHYPKSIQSGSGARLKSLAVGWAYIFILI